MTFVFWSLLDLRWSVIQSFLHLQLAHQVEQFQNQTVRVCGAPIGSPGFRSHILRSDKSGRVNANELTNFHEPPHFTAEMRTVEDGEQR